MNITHSKTKELTTCALLVALVFVATKAINIPTAIGGVINLADSIILVIAVLESKRKAAFIAGSGSFIAEFFSPYAIFAPATLVIKASMGFVVSFIYNSKLIKQRHLKMLFAFIVAELMMISGYFIYQAFFLNLGVYTASLDIISNVVQASASIIIAFVLTNIIERYM